MVESHRRGHVVELVSNTTVGQVENGDQEEDGTSVETLPDLIDKRVVPEYFRLVERAVAFTDVARLGGVPPSATTLEHAEETASPEQLLEYENGLVSDGSLGRGFVKLLVNDNQDDGDKEVTIVSGRYCKSYESTHMIPGSKNASQNPTYRSV